MCVSVEKVEKLMKYKYTWINKLVKILLEAKLPSTLSSYYRSHIHMCECSISRVIFLDASLYIGMDEFGLLVGRLYSNKHRPLRFVMEFHPIYLQKGFMSIHHPSFMVSFGALEFLLAQKLQHILQNICGICFEKNFAQFLQN